MVDLIGFLNKDMEDYFFEKSIYYDKYQYKMINNPYYHKKFIKYINENKRYIQYIFQKKLFKNKKNFLLTKSEVKKVVEYIGGNKINILNENQLNLFNYFDNIHDFSNYSHINIDYKYYDLEESNIKSIKKSKIEDSFMNQVNRKYFYEMNIQNSNHILNSIYHIIENYNIINDASGFSAIFSKVGYVSHTYYEHILERIKERKYSINTLANFLDPGNSLKSYIETTNNRNHHYKNINNVLDIINVYNYFLEEIFYNKSIHLFPKIDFSEKDIMFKIFIKDKKISENKTDINGIHLYKGFNSIDNIISNLRILEILNKKETYKKYINHKYFFLRLKSMGDRIQAYEVYYTNKKLLTPIIVLKNKKLKKYNSNKKLLLSTNDKMLTYFSMNGFDKMNILSIYKNYIILKNDFH
jgi:hypothetical protein